MIYKYDVRAAANLICVKETLVVLTWTALFTIPELYTYIYLTNLIVIPTRVRVYECIKRVLVCNHRNSNSGCVFNLWKIISINTLWFMLLSFRIKFITMCAVYTQHADLGKILPKRIPNIFQMLLNNLYCLCYIFNYFRKNLACLTVPMYEESNLNFTRFFVLN